MVALVQAQLVRTHVILIGSFQLYVNEKSCFTFPQLCFIVQKSKDFSSKEKTSLSIMSFLES
jgi:hypothetical protein